MDRPDSCLAKLNLRNYFPIMRLMTFAFLALFAASAEAQQYDLLLKGGHVIDPRNNRDGVMDVAVAGISSGPRRSVAR